MKPIAFLASVLCALSLCGPVQADTTTAAKTLKQMPKQGPATGLSGVVQTFDGKLVNLAFVETLVKRPPLAFDVFEVAGNRFLSITVFSQGKLITRHYAEPRAAVLGDTKLATTRYPIVAKFVTTFEFGGEDAWPFTGEPGIFIRQDTTYHTVQRGSIARGNGPLPAALIASETVSIPISTEGQRFESLFQAVDGEVIDQSSGLTVASSGGVITNCDIAGDQAADSVEAVLTDIRDSNAAQLGRKATAKFGGVFLIYVTKGKAGPGAGATMAESGAFQAGVATGNMVASDVIEDVLLQADNARNYVLVELARGLRKLFCVDVDGLDQDIIEIGLSDGPGQEPVYRTVLVCLEWREEDEYAVENDEGGYDVTYVRPVCLKYGIESIETNI